eukprot:TRINITY_DN4981_c0_g1_i1.p1 TRINITY_DN4981_c0_g1~~TRINITY_DN4981_c0_g1_i1.p1  ORF type:complete len:882 (-),score=169.57 TRINITY_DN4981_c0_g1_i1:218-2863(-)
MPLHLRDLSLLILACSAVLLSLYQEGDYTFQLSWFHGIDLVPGSSYRNFHAPDPSEKSPQPLITDLEGDGHNEIILATREPKLKIFDAVNTGGNEQLVLRKEVSLLATTMVKTGRQPIALATGYIEPYNPLKSRAQVIVVVTDGWSILCFDDKLRLLWERTVDNGDLSDNFLSEVAVVINSHRMLANDTMGSGVIVVGGRLEPREMMDPSSVESATTRHTDDEGGRRNMNDEQSSPMSSSVDVEDMDDDDPSTGKENAKKNDADAHKSSPSDRLADRRHIDTQKKSDKGSSSNSNNPPTTNHTWSTGDEGPASATVDRMPTGRTLLGTTEEAMPDANEYIVRMRRKSRTVDGDEADDSTELFREKDHGHVHMPKLPHFSFYAFSGLTGALRWKHEARDFYEETSSTDMLRPQHDPSHVGELTWRAFKNDVLNSLPHLWSTREHTRFDLFQYQPPKNPGFVSNKKSSTPIRNNEWDSDQLRKTDVRAVSHSKPANLSASVSSLSSQGAISSGDAHNHLLHQSTSSMSMYLPFGGLLPHAASEHVENPNVVVAHLRDGIEVIHFYSGRPLCHLSLKRDVAHVDMNGDGVIDHVEAVAGVHSPYSSHRAGAADSHSSLVPKCLALITSGIPASQQLYNGSICLQRSLFVSMENGIKDNSDSVKDKIMVAPPLAMLERDPDGDNLILSEMEHDVHKRYSALFFVNDGTITCFDHAGKRLWQKRTKAIWPLELSENDVRTIKVSGAEGFAYRRQSFLPSITPYLFPSINDGLPDHVVVVGLSFMSVLSAEGGVLRTETPINDLTMSPPIIGDFNNDGFNDIILVGTQGYYGFLCVRSIGFKLLTVLVGILLVAMLIAFAIRLTGGTDGDQTSELQRLTRTHANKQS